LSPPLEVITEIVSMSRIAAKLSNITPGKLDTEKGEEKKYQMHRAVVCQDYIKSILKNLKHQENYLNEVY
jgi:hypothetical protein